MGRNHEVTNRQPLLDGRGNLQEPGWSRSQVQQYDRSRIKAPKWRIKEWDYYLVLSDGFAGDGELDTVVDDALALSCRVDYTVSDVLGQRVLALVVLLA